jgi:hypothetical protein
MNKTRFTGLIIVSALILAAALAFYTSSSRASSNADGKSQVSIGLPDTGSGDLTASGPTRASCFSAAYHAASDCDRLESMQVAFASTLRDANGPNSQNCFSEAYHAASDCDRIASAIK